MPLVMPTSLNLYIFVKSYLSNVRGTGRPGTRRFLGLTPGCASPWLLPLTDLPVRFSLARASFAARSSFYIQPFKLLVPHLSGPSRSQSNSRHRSGNAYRRSRRNLHEHESSSATVKQTFPIFADRLMYELPTTDTFPGQRFCEIFSLIVLIINDFLGEYSSR